MWDGECPHLSVALFDSNKCIVVDLFEDLRGVVVKLLAL